MPDGEPAPLGPDASPVWSAERRIVIAGTLLALASAFLYGANVPAARAASQAGMPGAELIFYRALWLVPLLGIITLASRETLRIPPGERMAVLRLALTSGLTATFYLSALDHLPVALTVILFYTFPLMVMVISNRLAGRWLDRRQVAVFLVAFAGLVLAVGPSLADLNLQGVSLALAGALACAGLFIVAGNVSGPPTRTMFWTQVGVLPIALGYALLNGGPVPVSTFFNAPVAILIAMAGYAVGYLTQLMAARRISPSRMGLLFLFEPVTAILVAALFLGERLAPLQIAGVAIIIAALAAEIAFDARWFRRARTRAGSGDG